MIKTSLGKMNIDLYQMIPAKDLLSLVSNDTDLCLASGEKLPPHRGFFMLDHIRNLPI